MERPYFLYLIQIGLLIFALKVHAQNCFDNDNEIKCKLGTKTPYRFVANYNESRPNFPGCTEKKIWMMVRHGTRFPHKKDIKLMNKNLEDYQKKIIENFNKNNSEFPADFIRKLSTWKLTVHKDQAVHLTEEGKNELIDLAERMQARFPSLFVQNYDKKHFKFKFTNTQRTLKSAKYFTLGLFGQSQIDDISFPEPEDKDPILRFYKRCQRWREYKESNPYQERDLFIQGEIVNKMLSAISQKAGFKVNYDDVKLMYTTCGFETAWNRTTESPWCDIFSFHDMKVLEFIQDLNYYSVDGYGYNLNYEQACPAFEDMFKFLDSTKKALVTVYFTHSGTILKMLSKLGIAKDEKPLTHQSFSWTDTRHWRVSLIDAFGSNIAAVLYNCGINGQKVLMMHQERAVRLPGCPKDSMLCPMSVMKDIFPDKHEECRFDEICAFR